MNCAKFRLVRNLLASAAGAAIALSQKGATGWALPPSAGAARSEVVSRRSEAAAGHDIVFAAANYRKSGRFYQEGGPDKLHGKPEDETLDFVSQALYLVRTNGTGLRRLAVGGLQCESPKWSPDGKRIAFIGSPANGIRHIYVVNADGSRLRRMTSGRLTDSAPQWSPSGNGEILFLRHRSDNRWAEGCPGSVWIVGIGSDGGSCHVHEIITSPAKVGGPSRAQWSPNGQYVAALFGPSYEDGNKQALRAVDVVRRSVRTYPATGDFAWSPDSHRLVVVGTDKKASIVDIERGTKTEVVGTVRAPVWLSRDSWIGMEGHGELRRFSGTGNVLDDVTLSHDTRDHSDLNEIDDYEGDTWFLPDHSGSTGLLSAKEGMSDGKHFQSFRIDLKSGAFRLMRSGQCFAIAPSGDSFLVSDDNWVGPYKRGGERVGPLELVDLHTGRVKRLSNALTVIMGADWRSRGNANQ